MAGHLGAEEICLIIDVCYELEILGGHRLEVSGAHDTGVADEGVKCSEIDDGLFNEVMKAVHIGNVGLHEYRLVRFGDLIEGGGCLLAGHLVEVGDHDVRSLLDQFTGNTLAEALGGSCDDDGFALDPALGSRGGHFAAVVLDLPVVYEGNLTCGHGVLPAEEGSVPCDLHGVREHFGDGLGLLGVGSCGDKSYSFDEQHFRGVASLLNISLDLLLGLLHEILGTLMVDVDEFALAVDDAVGSERLHHRCGFVLSADEPADEGVIGDFQGLKSPASTAENRPYGGDGLADTVANSSLALGNGLDQLLEGGHDSRVCRLDLIGGLATHEYAVILEEYHLRLDTTLLTILFDLVIDLLEKGVTGIGVRDVQSVREELSAFRRSVF